MVKPKFTTDFLEAVVREGADELTLRTEAEGMLRTFTDTTDVGARGTSWESPKKCKEGSYLRKHDSDLVIGFSVVQDQKSLEIQ